MQREDCSDNKHEDEREADRQAEGRDRRPVAGGFIYGRGLRTGGQDDGGASFNIGLCAARGVVGDCEVHCLVFDSRFVAIVDGCLVF